MKARLSRPHHSPAASGGRPDPCHGRSGPSSPRGPSPAPPAHPRRLWRPGWRDRARLDERSKTCRLHLHGNVDVLCRSRGAAYRDGLGAEDEPGEPLPVEHAPEDAEDFSDGRHGRRDRAAHGRADGCRGRRGESRRSATRAGWREPLRRDRWRAGPSAGPAAWPCPYAPTVPEGPVTARVVSQLVVVERWHPKPPVAARSGVMYPVVNSSGHAAARSQAKRTSTSRRATTAWTLGSIFTSFHPTTSPAPTARLSATPWASPIGRAPRSSDARAGSSFP